MANVNAPENDDFQLGGHVGGAQEDVDRQRAAAAAAAGMQAPTVNYAGGDQYGNLASGARGGAVDALGMIRDRANGIHTAANATAMQGNAQATAMQRSIISGGRGQASIAGAPQQAAGIAGRMATDTRNNMNITNAQDTALAQNQMAQGYGQLRQQDASAQHTYDTRSQFGSDLQARQNAMSDQGQLGYERLAAGTQASRLAAEQALNDAQDQQWSSQGMAHEQAAGLAQQQALMYGSAAANAGGAAAGYGASQGGGNPDPGYDYSDPSNGEINRANPYSDGRVKENVTPEGYAKRVLELQANRQAGLGSVDSAGAIGANVVPMGDRVIPAADMVVPNDHRVAREELGSAYQRISGPIAERVVAAATRKDGKAGWLEKVSAGVAKGTNRALDATAQYRPQQMEMQGRGAASEPVAGSESAASSQMLDHVKPVSFNYKPGFGGPERNYGVLAQDLEKSPMGASLVQNDGGPKKVDVAKATMANLSATADLHQRVKALEGSGKIDDDAAKRMSAHADGMARSMDAQFAYSDEVVKDDIVKEGISPQEAYASRVNELRADAKMGEPEAPRKLANIVGAVQNTIKASQHDWNVEGELGRHNKALLKAPKNYRDEGTTDITESPNGEHILSALNRGGRTNVAGVSQDSLPQSSLEMMPANERAAYWRLKVKNDMAARSSNRHGMSPDALNMTPAWDGVTAPQEAPTGKAASAQLEPIQTVDTKSYASHNSDEDLDKKMDRLVHPPAKGEAAASKAPAEAVDPATLTSSPGRQPADIETGDKDALTSDQGMSLGGSRTVPAHYQDLIGPEAWALLSNAERARFTAGDNIAKRSMDQSHADEKAADEAIGVADRAAIHAGNMQSDLAPRHEDLDAKANEILSSAKHLANYHEDPNHFWGTRTTPQRVAGFIGVLLGGFAQGIRGGQNVALEQLNKAQDDSIAAQRHNYMANRDSLESKRSAFGMAMERYNGDEKVATAAVRLAQLDKRDAIAMKAAAQHSGTDTMNRLDMFLADSEKLRAEEVIKYKRWLQASTTGLDMGAYHKIYSKYRNAVLERLHAGEGGTPPLDFFPWLQGELGGHNVVPEGAVVGPHTSKGAERPMVHTPEGEFQARSDKDAEEYKQRMEGADEFEAAIKTIADIRAKGSTLSPADRAAAESAAVAAKNAFVKGEGFKRTPAQTEFEALDKIIPAHGGQMSMTADRQLTEAQKIVGRWRDTARKNYLVPSSVGSGPATPSTFGSK